MTMIVEDVYLDGIPCQAEIDTWPAEPMTPLGAWLSRRVGSLPGAGSPRAASPMA